MRKCFHRVNFSTKHNFGPNPLPNLVTNWHIVLQLNRHRSLVSTASYYLTDLSSLFHSFTQSNYKLQWRLDCKHFNHSDRLHDDDRIISKYEMDSIIKNTLGSACEEFGYKEHPASTNIFSRLWKNSCSVTARIIREYKMLYLVLCCGSFSWAIAPLIKLFSAITYVSLF